MFIPTGEHILLHQQGHFDSGKIFARKLRKDLAEAVKYTPIVSPRRLDSIYKATAKALDGMPVLYDDENNHALIIDKQERWNLQILKILDSFDTYSVR